MKANEKPADEKLLFAEILRRRGFQLRDTCFKEQDIFLDDPATIKGAQTSRRAGKTHTAGTFLIEGARAQPGSMNPYIALTRDSAARILWPTLELLNRQFRLGARMVESKLTMHFDNGSQLFLVGADQKNFIERLRGIKIKRAAIDETQSFGVHIHPLVFDVIEPALVDFNGQLALFGTPGVKPQGFFFDICHGKIPGVPIHKWTLLSNPFLPHAKEFIETLKERHGWSDQNPTLLREWLNLWVLDLDALVYKFDMERNSYEELPALSKAESRYRVLGIDFGYSPDPCAFVVLSFSRYSPYTYVEYAQKYPELTVSDIAEKAKELIKRYSPAKIVADTGGLGKTIAAELVKRFGIPVHPAEKKEKLANQQLMNGDFIDSKLKVHTSLTLLREQLQTLTKDEDGEEDKRLPNDLCDALLYAWRESRAYASQQIPKKVSRDSEEFMEQYWEREAEKATRKEQQAAEGDW